MVVVNSVANSVDSNPNLYMMRHNISHVTPLYKSSQITCTKVAKLLAVWEYSKAA